MGIALIIFGVISVIAGASEGVSQPIIFGIITIVIGIALSNKKEQDKKEYNLKVEESKKLHAKVPVREYSLDDNNIKESDDSKEIMNRFKNNTLCKKLLKELTEEDLYKSIEVYEDKIIADKKQYVYEDYGLRELESNNDTSALANYLGMNLTKDNSYLIVRIKNGRDRILGYRVYKDK
ncbi:MAG: hypothetical protein Q4E69_01915 [Bacilli bacterium]|nr:hypothetical protein [Bacilli bacterium]